MAVWAAQGEVELLLEAFGSISGRGLEPNVGSFEQLVALYATHGDMDRVAMIFREVRMRHMKPSEHMYACVFEACATQPGSALLARFSSTMEQDGVRASASVFHGLIKAHVRHGDLAAALCYLDAMKYRRVTPKLASYNVLLAGLADLDGHSEAFTRMYAVFNDMKQVGLTPSAETLWAMARGAAYQGFSKKTLALVQEAQAAAAAAGSAQEGGAWTLSCHRAVVILCAVREDVGRLEDHYAQALQLMTADPDAVRDRESPAHAAANDIFAHTIRCLGRAEKTVDASRISALQQEAETLCPQHSSRVGEALLSAYATRHMVWEMCEALVGMEKRAGSTPLRRLVTPATIELVRLCMEEATELPMEAQRPFHQLFSPDYEDILYTGREE
jgi:hypothetical protein